MSWTDLAKRSKSQREAMELHGYEIMDPALEQEARMRGHIQRCNCCGFDLFNGKVIIRSEPLCDNALGWGRHA